MTTITVDRAVLEQVLEALEFHSCGDEIDEQIITALRAALAQQEQEPGAWVDEGSIAWLGEQRSLQRRKVRSRREWQGLSEEEIDDLSRTMVKGNKSVNWLTLAILAALKEKNA
jgi:hypothetical protein